MTICVETLRWSIGCYLENDFIEYTHMNPVMTLYLTLNQVYTQHNRISEP